MRQEFFRQLYELMKVNKDVYLISGDLGYGLIDKIRDDFTDRFYNVGAAEQAMMGIGIGLALEGKIPFCYSITPFLLYRPFEAIRNYIDHEQIPVIMVGSGRDTDYKADGFSHHSEDDALIMDCFKNINCFWPVDFENYNLENIVESKKPAYINLAR